MWKNKIEGKQNKITGKKEKGGYCGKVIERAFRSGRWSVSEAGKSKPLEYATFLLYHRNCSSLLGLT